MRFQITLAELFVGVTAWGICLALYQADFDSWVYALLLLGTVGCIIFAILFGRTIGGAALISFPLAWLLNWSLFVLTFSYVVRENGILVQALGPIAEFVSRPFFWLQNSVPLDGFWDTLFALVVMSSVQTMTVILAMWFLRWKRKRNPPA